MGFILSSKRLDLRSLNLRIAKTRIAPAPTTDATTMIAIKAVLLKPPDFFSVSLLDAATEAVELPDAVRVVVTYVLRWEVSTRVAAEVGETEERVCGTLTIADGVEDEDGATDDSSEGVLGACVSCGSVDDCEATGVSETAVVDVDEVVA